MLPWESQRGISGIDPGNCGDSLLFAALEKPISRPDSPGGLSDGLSRAVHLRSDPGLSRSAFLNRLDIEYDALADGAQGGVQLLDL